MTVTATATLTVTATATVTVTTILRYTILLRVYFCLPAFRGGGGVYWCYCACDYDYDSSLRNFIVGILLPTRV